MTLHDKAQKITTVILDIDGVLTDGRVGYGADDEIKFFHIRDGQGIRLAQRAGLRFGVLSGRMAPCNRRRAKELDFNFIYEGCESKLKGFEQLLCEHHLTAEECLYIGDDVIDIPPVRRCGIGVAVADASPDLIAVADKVTEKNGGYGAVREVLDWLLKERGLWDCVIQPYFA